MVDLDPVDPGISEAQATVADDLTVVERPSGTFIKSRSSDLELWVEASGQETRSLQQFAEGTSQAEQNRLADALSPDSLEFPEGRIFREDGSVQRVEDDVVETVNEDFSTAEIDAGFIGGARELVEQYGPEFFDEDRETIEQVGTGERTRIQTTTGDAALIIPGDRAARFEQAAGAESIDLVLNENPELAEKGLGEQAKRRLARNEATDAAEAAGIDTDEFGIDARSDGTVVLQDRDTNQTRTIDADAPGGVGSAIDAATGNGQFVADDADPAASGSGSGDGLGARAAGAIVLLFGAIAAALGWLS